MSRLAFVMVAAAALFSAPAMAHDFIIGSLKIDHPWARATPKGASVGGGYMKITNNGAAADRLIGGSSDVSKRVEIHAMSMDSGVMKMRAMPKGLEIKPGASVEFKPGGYHVMFVGLNKPLVQGQQVNATLEFENAGKVPVSFRIEGIGAQTGGADHGGMQMKH